MIDAEERLRHWMRDYGHTSQRPFIADLEAVLADVERLRESNEQMVEAIKLTLHNLDYLSNLWGAEGVTRSVQDRLRKSIGQ